MGTGIYVFGRKGAAGKPPFFCAVVPPKSRSRAADHILCSRLPVSRGLDFRCVFAVVTFPVTQKSAAVLSPPLTLFTLLSAGTFLLLLVLFWRHNQFTHASVFVVGTLVPLPALWHSNGAGTGFPQRSCKTEARYVAKVCSRGKRAKQHGNNTCADAIQP